MLFTSQDGSSTDKMGGADNAEMQGIDQVQISNSNSGHGGWGCMHMNARVQNLHLKKQHFTIRRVCEIASLMPLLTDKLEQSYVAH